MEARGFGSESVQAEPPMIATCSKGVKIKLEDEGGSSHEGMEANFEDLHP